jgi:hypothetical protein
LINTPIIQSEDGSGLPNGYSASAFAFGINPEDDPELAMVCFLRNYSILSLSDFFRLFVFQWKNNGVYRKLKLVVVQAEKLEINKTHQQTLELQVKSNPFLVCFFDKECIY